MPYTVNFNFEYWMHLYREDPNLFEAKRKRILEEFIDKTRHSKRRLNGLQFKIDMERQKSRSAMGACIRLSDLMKAHFYDEFTPSVNTFNLPPKK